MRQHNMEYIIAGEEGIVYYTILLFGINKIYNNRIRSSIQPVSEGTNERNSHQPKGLSYLYFSL